MFYIIIIVRSVLPPFFFAFVFYLYFHVVIKIVSHISCMESRLFIVCVRYSISFNIYDGTYDKKNQRQMKRRKRFPIKWELAPSNQMHFIYTFFCRYSSVRRLFLFNFRCHFQPCRCIILLLFFNYESIIIN